MRISKIKKTESESPITIAIKMTERNSMFGLYQSMLNSSTKSTGTNNYGMMQTVFQQVHGILNKNMSSSNIDFFPQNVVENPYGFNEYIDPNMIIKMKTLFDNYCDIIDEQNNNISSKVNSPTKPDDDDENKEHKLDIKHLKDILQLFGFHLSDDEINKLQHTIKNLYSMQLTFDTLFQILIKEIDPSKDENILKSAFRACDVEKNNQLEMENLRQMLYDLNTDKFKEGQILHLIHSVNGDKNRDFLSLHDFRKMMNMDLRLFESVEFEYKTNTKQYKFQPPKQPTIKRTATPYRFTKASTINKQILFKSNNNRAKSYVFNRNYGTTPKQKYRSRLDPAQRQKSKSRPATAQRPIRSNKMNQTNDIKMNKTTIMTPKGTGRRF